MAVSTRLDRTEKDAFWIPQWLGGQGCEAPTSQRHIPSPGALYLTKSSAKVLEMLYFPLPCDLTG